jgi:menaquinone-9 beta-reductase
MSRDADVVIVGAGPAGSVTALLLARAGVRVLLLDRHVFPRAKPCGDCLSAAASGVLRRLGVLERVHALPHALLRGWRIIAPDGGAFTARFAAAAGTIDVPHALAVERARLDAALLDAAIEAGAEFRPRVHVLELLRAPAGGVIGVATSGGSLTARAVIGADGLRSIVATRLGVIRHTARLRKVSLTAHIFAPQLAATAGEMHIGRGVVAGVAAVDLSGHCNVTVVADSARHGRAVAADPAGFVATALDSLPRLRGRVPVAALRVLPLLASGPFDRPVRHVVCDGCALVGDAAGYYDPFTGQGIHQALCSAELLAPVLLRALDRSAVVSRRALRTYARQRRRLLRHTNALQHAIEAVISRPHLAARAVASLARTPRFAGALLDVTAGLHGPLRLLSPRVLSSLFATPIPPEQLNDDPGRAVRRRSRATVLPHRR